MSAAGASLRVVDTPPSTPDTPRPAPALATVAATLDGRGGIRVAGSADLRTRRAADATTPFHLCSMAKTVTAVGVLRLARDGVLDLDADVRDVLDVAVPHGVGPTVRQLLAHRGGIDDAPGSFTPTASPAPSTAHVLAGSTPHHHGPVRVTRPPGTAFAYSDAGYCLVERVVEVATGERFADAMHRVVVEPLGLLRTAFWAGETVTDGPRAATLARVARSACAGHHADGTRVDGGRVHYAGPAASGLWSAPTDVAVLLEDLLRAWTGDARAVVLDPGTAASMLSDPDGIGVGLGVFVGGSPVARVMTQGWGVGFQGQVRVDLRSGAAAAVLLAQDPGVPQEESVVGRTVLDLLAGLARP